VEAAIEFLTTMHWGAVLQIIAIDILLGGDNAVVIALACRNLPREKRMTGILWGTAGAIVLRVILIAFAVVLLQVPFLKLVGGALLLWIGVKLLMPEEEDEHGNIATATTLWSAVKTIVVADFVMSLDNVIAIAGAAQQADPDHQMGLVIFGLLVSIPIIVWGSTLVLRLIERFPIVITLGGALLGWIAGGMMITDLITVQALGGEPSEALKYAAEIAGAVLVVVLGKVLGARRKPAAQTDRG